jgi:hypothetical protein
MDIKEAMYYIKKMSEHEITNSYTEAVKIISDAYDAGMLIPIPCKVGSWVYTIVKMDCNECKKTTEAHSCITRRICPLIIKPVRFTLRMIPQVGTKYYLTEGAARAALEAKNE